MKYEGVVTEQDWKEGVPLSPTECPFAKAISKQFPGLLVVVSNFTQKKNLSTKWDIVIRSKIPSYLRPDPNSVSGCYINPHPPVTSEQRKEEQEGRMFKGFLSEAATALGLSFDNGMKGHSEYKFEFELEPWRKES